MVTDPIFLQAAKAIGALDSGYGRVRLAMMIASTSGHPDKWNLVISAEWLDGSSTRTSVQLISNFLARNLTKHNLSKIERISVLPTHDPFVMSIVRDLVEPIDPGTPYRVQSFDVNRLGLEDAVVLAARANGVGGYRSVSKVYDRR